MTSSPHPASDPTHLARHGAALRRMARGLVRDESEADDLVQEAALLALSGRARPRGPFLAFWRGVLQNLARRRAREEGRRRSRQTVVAGRGAATVEPTGDAIARLDVHARVLAAVRELPEPTRTTIVLRYLENLPPRHIAIRLDVPVGTVKARLKRGLQALRRRLDAAHDGDRRTWLGALLPSAWGLPAPALPTGGATALGGAMGIEGGRRLLWVGLVVVLLGGAGWLAAGPLSRDEAPAKRASMRVEPDAPAANPQAGQEPTLRGHADPGAARAAAVPPSAEAGPSDPTASSEGAATTAASGFRPTPLDEAAFAAAPPAQVASPFAPPPGTPVGAGMGPGGGGPTGHWTRFARLPARRGTARLAVLVLDEAGVPVAGADVYLAPPAAAGQEAISFGDLRTLGATGAGGRFDARDLPEGAGVVAANFQGRLNGRRGLDVRHARRVLLEAGRETRVRLDLPLAIAETGAVAGHVVDAEGAPIPSASVSTAFRRVWTDADGAFRIEGVAAGQVRLTVGATGRATQVVPVEIPAGGTKQVRVTLPFADTGSLRLEGRAALPDGTPVAGATVYLMVENERGTLRRTATDANGAFLLADLPDRLRSAPLKLQVSGFPRYRTGLLHLAEGLRDEQVVVEVPGAYAWVRLRLLDAATGEAIEVADVDFAGDDADAPGRHGGSLTFDRDAGAWEGFFDGGRGTLRAVTLTHGSWSTLLDLPPDGGEVETEARLARVAEDPIAVALDVRVASAADGAPVGQVRIEVLDAANGDPLSRFEGGRSDGRYRLPAPSGDRRLRVTAPGYEPHEEDLRLHRTLPETSLEVRLVPSG